MAPPLLIGALAVGTGMKVAGHLTRRKAIKRASEAEAQQVEELGARELRMFKEEGESLRGRQRSVVGAAGAELTGSPLLVALETERKLREDERFIKEQTKKRAASIRETGKAEATAELLGMGETLLTSGADFYGAFKGLPKGNRFPTFRSNRRGISYTGLSGRLTG